MRVLTFNSHQPYVHLLASSLPWTFGVITPNTPGAAKNWNPRIRPLPGNISLYRSVDEALRAGEWDWVLTHNVDDLLDVKAVSLPKTFLIHGTLSGRILQDRSRIDPSSYVKNVKILLAAHHARVVFVSELKQKDWGIPGDIIKLSVDIQHYGDYRGEIRGVLQVSNHLRERGAILGWDAFQSVCRDLPHLVLGANRGLSSSRSSEDWEDLKEQLRTYRVYLYTPLYPYEDGYNMALLEAMATGMPIAAFEHRSSPIRDGVEGVVAASADGLREKVLRLLDNREDAARMGRAARARVESEFPISRFRDSWQSFASTL